MGNQIREQFEKRSQRETVRLNKYLSESGICSRREADRLIGEGKVTVDGKKAERGMQILPDQKVCVDGKPVKPETKMVVLAVNKPVGIVCTEEKKEPNNIIRFLDYPTRITYVGRLDKDSEGLLLMTNNGDIINKMMRAGNCHEKEYMVKINQPVTDDFLRKMSQGVQILDTVTRPCKTEKIGKDTFRIILTQGLNRQIRRMCEACGCKVIKLKRIRIMNIHLGNLKPGEYRPLTDSELNGLYRMIAHSSNTTVIGKGEKKNRRKK